MIYTIDDNVDDGIGTEIDPNNLTYDKNLINSEASNYKITYDDSNNNDAEVKTNDEIDADNRDD